MNKKPIILLTMIISFIWVSSAHSNLCISCHPDIGKGHNYIHPAVNIGCESCHTIIIGKEHPEVKNSIKLKNDLPELCFQCHKKSKFTKKYVHMPIDKGMCILCHNPHQSDNKNLLLFNEPQEVCYRCHAREKFNKKYTHKVAEGGCGIRCHSHHSSDYPRLLSSNINDMCSGCHIKQNSGIHIVSLPRGKVHPIYLKKDPRNKTKEMTCISCHNPHGSKYRKLFTYKNICNRCHRSF